MSLFRPSVVTHENRDSYGSPSYNPLAIRQSELAASLCWLRLRLWIDGTAE